MTFDNINGNKYPLSCGITAEEAPLSEQEEDMRERRKMLEQLKEQIRAGTYRPTIGEIAINLIKGRHGAESF